MCVNGFLLLSNFSFTGCSIHYVVKILLDCSDDLKVKKTLDEKILGVQQRVTKGSCWPTADCGQTSAEREPGVLFQVALFLSMLDWQYRSLCKLEGPVTPALFLFVALLFSLTI